MMNYRNSTTISYSNNNFDIMSNYIKIIYDYFEGYKSVIINMTIRHSNKYSLIRLYTNGLINICMDPIIKINNI